MTAQTARALVLSCLQEIAPEADPATLADTDDLRVALDLDSMDFFNLIAALADATGLAIPDADAPQLTTLATAGAYLTDHAA